jgi:hypothetical protein
MASGRPHVPWVLPRAVLTVLEHLAWVASHLVADTAAARAVIVPVVVSGRHNVPAHVYKNMNLFQRVLSCAGAVKPMQGECSAANSNCARLA